MSAWLPYILALIVAFIVVSAILYMPLDRKGCE